MPSSLSSISSAIPEYGETEVIIEDDDTEKYLTNSSKKPKPPKVNNALLYMHCILYTLVLLPGEVHVTIDVVLRI